MRVTRWQNVFFPGQAVWRFALRVTLPVLIAAAAVTAPVTKTAEAASGGVVMGATVGQRQYCEILLVSAGGGTLGVDTSGTVLSSQQAGGAPALVQVTTTNASYDLTYEMPAAFAAEPAGNPGPVTFNGTITGAGATSFSNLGPATAKRLKKGVTNVTAHLTATNTGGTYAAGSYTAEAVLRCE